MSTPAPFPHPGLVCSKKLLLTTFLPTVSRGQLSLHITNGTLEHDARVTQGWMMLLTSVLQALGRLSSNLPRTCAQRMFNHSRNKLRLSSPQEAGGTFWHDLFLPDGASYNESSVSPQGQGHPVETEFQGWKGWHPPVYT